MINDNNDLIALPADAHNKLRNNHDIEIEYIKEMKKPKLRAYFDGNNYYIDKSAAYALKMIENEEFFASEDQFYPVTVDIINYLNQNYEIEMFEFVDDNKSDKIR